MFRFSLPILAIFSLAILASCTQPPTNRPTARMKPNDEQSIRTPSPSLSESVADTASSDISSPESSPSPVIAVDTSATTQSPHVTSPTPQTITKEVTYSTDHGKEQARVNFTLALNSDGTITSISARMLSGDHESAQYINRFNSAARSKIVGKKSSELSLSAIGGASDTTDAFNQIIGSL